jgi:AhpD family alkylhydroperoxidase
MFVTAIKDATPEVNGQSDLRHLLAFNPDSTRHLFAFTQSVMRSGPLSPGECELIAAITSQENQCAFCTRSHVAAATRLLGVDVVDRVLHRQSLTDREHAFWCLVDASHRRSTGDRRTLVDAAVQPLGADGFYHALSVIALFNFFNTFVDVAGVAELTPEGYDASGARVAEHGYTPQSR